jgi:hypothetical protein
MDAAFQLDDARDIIFYTEVIFYDQ